MDALYGILGIAVIIGLAALLSKGQTALSKATNKHVFYRSRYKTEQNLVSEHLVFDTTATMEEIIRCLTQEIAPVPKDKIPVMGKAALYESGRDSSGIAYACGNKAATSFTALIRFSKTGEKTRGVFRFVKWLTKDGMLFLPDRMKEFRQTVCRAFQEADPNVQITGASKSEE